MQTRRQFIVRGSTLVAAGAIAAATGPTIIVRDAKAGIPTPFACTSAGAGIRDVSIKLRSGRVGAGG